MFRVAILETQEVVKDIMFELSSTLYNQELVYSYYTKISQFANAEKEKEFQIIFFHEKFEVPRISQSFVLNNTDRIVIYTKTKVSNQEKEILPFARIIYIDRNHIKSELQRISSAIELLLNNQEVYVFMYNNVKVQIKISDIYYIEKQDKNLIFVTKRGEFSERKNMKDANSYFEGYHFLWIHASYLVNIQYITKIEHSTVYIAKYHFPISRAKKPNVVKHFQNYIKP